VTGAARLYDAVVKRRFLSLGVRPSRVYVTLAGVLALYLMVVEWALIPGRRYAMENVIGRIVIAGLVLLFLFQAWRAGRNRIQSSGCCRSCGYDLRATPAAGGELLKRCPECGAES